MLVVFVGFGFRLTLIQYSRILASPSESTRVLGSRVPFSEPVLLLFVVGAVWLWVPWGGGQQVFE